MKNLPARTGRLFLAEAARAMGPCGGLGHWGAGAVPGTYAQMRSPF